MGGIQSVPVIIFLVELSILYRFSRLYENIKKDAMGIMYEEFETPTFFFSIEVVP